MGKGLAKILSKKGANVILVARDVHKLEAAVDYISVCSSDTPHYVVPKT